jgi:hypothetical protein
VSVLRLAVTLVVPVLVAFALVLGATRIIGSEPQQSTWTPWGNRVASSPAELAGWLAARGSSYGEWARRHPAAAARLEGRAVVPARSPAAVEPPPGKTTLGEIRDLALLTASLTVLALVVLLLVFAGARRALVPRTSFAGAHRLLGSSPGISFREPRGRGRGGDAGPVGLPLGHRAALDPPGRSVATVEQTIRSLRWFYRTHREEILWLGLGSGCAVLASLAITL